MDIDPTVRVIILELRARVNAGGEGGMYGDRSKTLCDLDAILANPSATKVRELLLPTANLQELSMECGWGSHFNDLAAKLEKLLGIE